MYLNIIHHRHHLESIVISYWVFLRWNIDEITFQIRKGFKEVRQLLLYISFLNCWEATRKDFFVSKKYRSGTKSYQRYVVPLIMKVVRHQINLFMGQTNFSEGNHASQRNLHLPPSVYKIGKILLQSRSKCCCYSTDALRLDNDTIDILNDITCVRRILRRSFSKVTTFLTTQNI